MPCLLEAVGGGCSVASARIGPSPPSASCLWVPGSLSRCGCPRCGVPPRRAFGFVNVGDDNELLEGKASWRIDKKIIMGLDTRHIYYAPNFKQSKFDPSSI